jgi:serine/threonine protein kinase
MTDDPENEDSGDQPTVMGAARPRPVDQATVLGGAPSAPASDTGDQPTMLPGGPPRPTPPRGEEPTVMGAGAGGPPPLPTAARVRRPKMTFPPGTLVAERYRIVRFIAKGGMGEVYEAEDIQLKDNVALKTVLPEIAEQDNVLARFKREIQLARKVTHPNVCRIFDFGLHRGAPQEEGGEPLEVSFLTMELLPGESMSAMLRREGKMTPAQALPLVSQMAAALGAAHRQGIVHRDFKSANVMLLPESQGLRAVVTDFGLARRETSDGSLTGTGIVGTPDYMAPEQVEGGTISAATDIYALGAVLYEMVSSRLPFTAESALSIAVKRLSQPPEPLRPNVPDLDPVWEAAIMRCLERRAADRYQSVDELMRALTPGTDQGQPVRKDPIPKDDKTKVLPPPRPPRPPMPPEPPKPKPIALLAGGGLVLAALVGGGLWWALSGGKPEPSPSASTTTVTTAPGPVVPADRSRLAVFDLQNATGDPSLAWLRTALTDMLLTDLSQSTKIRVVGTDRVRQALKEMGRQDDSALSADDIREVAKRTGVGTVIMGSFVKAGDTLRIQVKAQDPATGDVLFSEQVDGPGQSQLFPMMAKLTGALRTKLQVEPTTALAPDKALEQFASGAAYEVPVSAGKATYKEGENLVVTVQMPRAGYLNLINVGEGDPEATLLFPNQFQPKNRFEAGARVTIPAAGVPFALPASLPPGLSKQAALIVAIHTQQPLNGYEMGLAKADALSLLKGADTGAFFAAAKSGGEFGAGKQVVTITR